MSRYIAIYHNISIYRYCNRMYWYYTATVSIAINRYIGILSQLSLLSGRFCKKAAVVTHFHFRGRVVHVQPQNHVQSAFSWRQQHESSMSPRNSVQEHWRNIPALSPTFAAWIQLTFHWCMYDRVDSIRALELKFQSGIIPFIFLR